MAIQNNMQSVSDYSRAMSSVLQRLTTDGSASDSLLHSAVSVWFIRSQLFSRLQGMSPKIQLKRRTQNLKLNSTHFKTKTKNKNKNKHLLFGTALRQARSGLAGGLGFPTHSGSFNSDSEAAKDMQTWADNGVSGEVLPKEMRLRWALLMHCSRRCKTAAVLGHQDTGVSNRQFLWAVSVQTGTCSRQVSVLEAVKAAAFVEEGVSLLNIHTFSASGVWRSNGVTRPRKQRWSSAKGTPGTVW